MGAPVATATGGVSTIALGVVKVSGAAGGSGAAALFPAASVDATR